jgi:DNA primase
VISPETIALVRERTDILAIVQEAVPSLKRRGRSFVGLCPFHKEKTPSFHVNPDRGFFHCFGCKEAGSAIDFLIKHEGYTFPEAVRSLAERAGITVEESQKDAAFTESDRQKKARDELYAVNALAATFFEDQMRRHEHRGYALEELAKRGLEPGKDKKIDDVLQAFRIGYAPSGWDGLATFCRAQGISPTAAETVGLLVPRSSGSGFYDRFRHRLMFAVIDAQGRVVAFSGRALRELPEPASASPTSAGASSDPEPAPVRSALRYVSASTKSESGPPPKYINSPESPIYTKGQMLFGIHQARHAIRQAELAVLVEGNFDVVSLHARGLDNVVAPLGTAFTGEQAKLLKRFAPSVVFLFDGDAAGKKAVRLSREAIRAAGMNARVATLPDGVDPDELSRVRGASAIEDLVNQARGMAEAFIEMELDATFVQADVFERVERIERIRKVIGDEDDPIMRMELFAYADHAVSARLDLHGMRVGRDDVHESGPFAALQKSLRRDEATARARGEVPRTSNASPKEARIGAKTPGAPERREIVGCLIEWPSLLEDAEVAEELTLLEGPSVMLVASLRRAWKPIEKTLNVEKFLAEIPPAVRSFANERLASPESESEAEAKGYLLENANKLKRLLLSQEAAQITRETYRAQGDWDTERELLREAADRLRAKHGLKA